MIFLRDILLYAYWKGSSIVCSYAVVVSACKITKIDILELCANLFHLPTCTVRLTLNKLNTFVVDTNNTFMSTLLQVDVIVNSINCSLQLFCGAVSQTIQQDGGKHIETECRQNAPNGIQFGEVVVTSGGRLSCQYIVHGACCDWDGGAGQSEQVCHCVCFHCHMKMAKLIMLQL